MDRGAVIVSNIILTPSDNCYISDKKPYFIYPDKGWFYTGIDCDGAAYRSLLKFDLGGLPGDADIDSAYLRLYSKNKRIKNETSCITPFMITTDWSEGCVNWSNQPQIDTEIRGNTVEVEDSGWYKWDIKNIIGEWRRGSFSNYGFMLRTPEKYSNDIRRFYSAGNPELKAFQPTININYSPKDGVSLDSRRTTSRFQQFNTRDYYRYSSWFRCSDYTTYSFFVQNIGSEPAEVFIQLSPDKSACFNERTVFCIGPGEGRVIVPLEYSFFARLAFKSLNTGHRTALKLWFQGQV